MDRLFLGSSSPPSRYQTAFAFSLLSVFFAGLLLLKIPDLSVLSRPLYLLPKEALQHLFSVESKAFSRNVSTCPGYNLGSLQETDSGLLAQLNLAGPACNAFGLDVHNLTLEVTYDTEDRLHVVIYDTAREHFAIPTAVVHLSGPDGQSHKDSSDLVFNYESSPFAFWITRRSDPYALPLFDTRTSSLPKTPISSLRDDDPSSALDGFPLLYEDQYLQIASALPKGANIYGLGEVLASSGLRRDVGEDGGRGTIQAMWNRDVPDPIDRNVYGAHPVYMEHRFSESTNRWQTHGVYLHSAAASDILLMTPAGSNVSLVEYRLIGGTLDFYFFSGPTPQNVIEQYGALVGLPTWQPAWAFGFQLCRWGYASVDDTREQVARMRDADIPLEVIWNDIDLYHALRDFTSDPVSFPPDEMRDFIRELAANDQHYIPITDAGIPVETNNTDHYLPHRRGKELDVFLRNPDGSDYIGQVWPGYTVFPDFFAPNAQEYWTEALRNWTELGIEYSGIWLDMNEAASFCDGSCGTTANLSNTSAPFLMPGDPANPVLDYPEGYNSSVWGPSGNRTINGSLTYSDELRVDLGARWGASGTDDATSKRSLKDSIDYNAPPYAIHNGYGRLSANGIATNATHSTLGGGYVELDVHNLYGLMGEKATFTALQTLHPGKRPFIISRSTFASSGRWTGHWLGDNFSKWRYMYFSIQGVLQFQLFQIPFTGADTCGFNGNTDEELCNRWMQLSAWLPFFRNHNIKGALPQEPYRWDSVAEVSRQAIRLRYSLLPYWYTLFANASLHGTPPVRALFWEFPDEPELFRIDRQFLLGHDLLVTPVLTPNASTVDGIFPGRGSIAWRDFFTHQVQPAIPGMNVTLDAPLGHLPVHIREGAAILTYSRPGYTIAETMRSPTTLVVFQAHDGYAFGHAYFDDGESMPPTPHRDVWFRASAGRIDIESQGDFEGVPRLESVTVLNAPEPVRVRVDGREVHDWEYLPTLQKLVIHGLDIDLKDRTVIEWA